MFASDWLFDNGVGNPPFGEHLISTAFRARWTGKSNCTAASFPLEFVDDGTKLFQSPPPSNPNLCFPTEKVISYRRRKTANLLCRVKSLDQGLDKFATNKLLKPEPKLRKPKVENP